MKFKSTEPLFARIRENLSSYSSLGMVDEGKFFFEVKWFISTLGISMLEIDEDVIHLKDYKHELPCNFNLLESAWLCDMNNSQTKTVDNFQGKVVIYTENTCEKVVQATCSQDERVVDKITVKEYVQTNPTERVYNSPILLALSNKLTKQVCAKDCQNLFSANTNDISILRRGASYYLFSSLEKPTIYLRYYAYPIDEETGLPLIPDEPIIEKALEDHLMLYFFKNLWLNDDNPNVQQKIGYLKEESIKSMGEAEYFVKLPSFNKMIETTRRQRKRYNIYNQQLGIHY
jgi:hypothetical protein